MATRLTHKRWLLRLYGPARSSVAHVCYTFAAVPLHKSRFSHRQRKGQYEKIENLRCYYRHNIWQKNVIFRTVRLWVYKIEEEKYEWSTRKKEKMLKWILWKPFDVLYIVQLYTHTIGYLTNGKLHGKVVSFTLLYRCYRLGISACLPPENIIWNRIC